MIPIASQISIPALGPHLCPGSPSLPWVPIPAPGLHLCPESLSPSPPQGAPSLMQLSRCPHSQQGIILERGKIIKASSISPCSFVLLQPGLMGLLSSAQTHPLFLIGHKSKPQNNPSFSLGPREIFILSPHRPPCCPLSGDGRRNQSMASTHAEPQLLRTGGGGEAADAAGREEGALCACGCCWGAKRGHPCGRPPAGVAASLLLSPSCPAWGWGQEGGDKASRPCIPSRCWGNTSVPQFPHCTESSVLCIAAFNVSQGL